MPDHHLRLIDTGTMPPKASKTASTSYSSYRKEISDDELDQVSTLRNVRSAVASGPQGRSGRTVKSRYTNTIERKSTQSKTSDGAAGGSKSLEGGFSSEIFDDAMEDPPAIYIADYLDEDGEIEESSKKRKRVCLVLSYLY